MALVTVPESWGSDLFEYNPCHDHGTGRFCSKTGDRLRHAHIMRRSQAKTRLSRLRRQLDRAMTKVGGRTDRAVALRRRYDVLAPIATAARRQSIWGTWFNPGER